MRLGIFGGSFNPIHNGHVRMLEFFIDKLDLDEVLLIPTGISPHKNNGELLSSEDRFYLCKLATKNMEKVFVSDIEIKREGKSLTYDTLEIIKEEYPGDDLFLLMGSDMFLSFESWVNAEEIMEDVTLCTVPRTAADEEKLHEHGRHLYDKGAAVFVGDLLPLELSSTEIRYGIKAGGKAESSLDARVLKYINALHLYQAEKDEEIEGYISLVEQEVSQKRLHHSIMVAKAAAYISVLYGADARKAYIAGILHDILRDKSESELLNIVDNARSFLADKQMQSPRTWHGTLAGEYLKQKGICMDEDILNAIRYHTLARSNMSVLEKAIFVGDTMSFDREHDQAEILKEKIDISLAEGMHIPLVWNIKELAQNNIPIMEGLIAAYNENLKEL